MQNDNKTETERPRLSAEQQAAVELTGQRMTCIAGPGSGKTHMLVERIARDVEQQRIDSQGIAAVTFTNASANELRERLERRGIAPHRIGHIGTLHSWARRVIRANRGSAAATELLTDRKLRELVVEVKRKLGSMARDLSLPEAWHAAVEPPRFGNRKKVGWAIRNAVREINQTHPDLMLAELLDVIPDCQVGPSAIYVDEYQDSAPIDARIYHAWIKRAAQYPEQPQTELFVVGDPRQAIYGFRGATLQNLADAWALSDATAQLTASYRSATPICIAASQLARQIGDGIDGMELNVRPARHRHGSVQLHRYANEAEEAMAAVEWAQLAEPAATTAILCRYNETVRQISGILTSRGIPHGSSAPEIEGTEIRESAQKVIAAQWTPPQDAPDRRAAWRDQMVRLGISAPHRDALMDRLLRVRLPEHLIGIEDELEAREAQRLHVATIHAAKGLEWDRVALLGADHETYRPLHESARMLFVAITRARTELMVSSAKSRPIPGTAGRRHDDLTPTPMITRHP